MHGSSEEFEIQPDPTIWLKLGQIRPLTAELAALERLKNPHRLIMGKTVLPLFLGCS